MNSIKIIQQNAKMWLDNKYIQGFARQCIQDIKEANKEDNKAPRTGFKKPTDKERREFNKFFKCKKCKGKKVRSSRGLVCSNCDIK